MAMITCPQCGQKTPDTALFCPSCHHQLKSPYKVVPTVPSKRTLMPFTGTVTANGPDSAVLWRRFIALLFDLLLLGGLSVFAIHLIPGLGSLLAAWVYFAGFETSTWQGTPGKRMLGIRVVDVNGVKLRFGRASLRFFCRFLSALPLGGGYLLALFSPHRQTLHDMLASTRVVMR